MSSSKGARAWRRATWCHGWSQAGGRFQGRHGFSDAGTSLSADRARQKVEHRLQIGRRVEHRAAMSCSVDHDERDIEAQFLVGALQFVRLVNWHLRILIAVQKHERR